MQFAEVLLYLLLVYLLYFLLILIISMYRKFKWNNRLSSSLWGIFRLSIVINFLYWKI